jgi:hypothetical protein
MEHLTVDEIRDADPDLDRALARAIRRLIAEAGGRDPAAETAQKV